MSVSLTSSGEVEESLQIDDLARVHHEQILWAALVRLGRANGLLADHGVMPEAEVAEVGATDQLGKGRGSMHRRAHGQAQAKQNTQSEFEERRMVSCRRFAWSRGLRAAPAPDPPSAPPAAPLRFHPLLTSNSMMCRWMACVSLEMLISSQLKNKGRDDRGQYESEK